MITRKIGGIIRGESTPAQLILAAVMGAILGFMPGFAQAPGLIVLVVMCLVVLNANLGLALLVALLARLVAWLMMPATFLVGRFFLDGPIQGLFAAAINAPVLAYFGFEYYLTTGGLFVGLFFGLVVGLFVARGITAFRRRMAGLEENSERYKNWTAKWWVRALLYIFVGGGAGKLTYAQLLERKIGNPIRPLGVAVAGVIVLGLIGLRLFASDEMLTAVLQQGLERANGATVDLSGVELSLSEGRLTINGLAMADPNALDTDLLRAVKVEASISGADLLRKRLSLDLVRLTDAAQGTKRATPGRRIGPAPQPLPQEPGGKSLDDYLKDAQKWRDRLTQARQWLDKLSSSKAPTGETNKQRLDRLVREEGYARVRADHLVEGAATFLISKLIAEKVRAPKLQKDETLDIIGENLSTQPNLLAKPPTLTIKSSGGTIDFGADLSGASAGGGQNTLRLSYLGLPVQSVAASLAGSPVSGGSIDLKTQGTFVGGRIDMPLSLTLHNTNISGGGGAGATKVQRLTIPITLRGPLDSPGIIIDPKALAQALVDAGAQHLAEQWLDKAGIKGVDVGKVIGPNGLKLPH